MKRTESFAAAILFGLVSRIGICAPGANVWPGVAPGSEHWNWKEVVAHGTPSGTVVLDVVTPTLTPFLPASGKATGTGVIVAPGGYCLALAMDLEGNEVARWLQQRGIAAFVLKYRLKRKLHQGIPKHLDMDAACKYGIADAKQAIKDVRAHAAAWRVDPDKVGIVGFSAGGMVASGALLQDDASARPNFAGLIYGAPFGVMPSIPTELPPVFLAWAQDDTLAGDAMTRLFVALQKAGAKPEVHIFSSGGHGFGMRKQNTTSDHWIDAFYWWLQAHGFAAAPKR